MKLHELPSLRKHKSPRVGRGGKRGTTSGRGQKGQKSRAGHRIRPASRDLILKLPKRRGFNNKPTSPKPFIVNVGDIARKAASLLAGGKEITVDQATLKQIGLVPQKFRGAVKILGKGTVSHPLIIKKLRVSAGAKVEIEKAGGKIISE